MFDVPLRQARDFQKQNVNLARYALFREDIRDLAALTTDKAETKKSPLFVMRCLIC